MNKISIFISTVLISLQSMAMAKDLVMNDCGYRMIKDQQEYCVDIQWEEATVKKNGAHKKVKEMSPQYIKMNTPGSLWKYSNAYIKIWLYDDVNKKSVKMKEQYFRVFPFMEMIHGHAHGTGYDFVWNDNLDVYELVEVTFLEMQGCWSLRWTSTTVDNIPDSQLLVRLENFVNINKDEKEEIKGYCEMFKSQKKMKTPKGIIRK
jgi:hypothetical protein